MRKSLLKPMPGIINSLEYGAVTLPNLKMFDSDI